MRKRRVYIYLSIALLVVFGLPFIVEAFPIAIPGTEGLPVIVNSTDDVIATYQGNSATYSNDLYLGPTFIFNNHSSLVGSTVNLGSFPVGTELIFRLHVNNTGYDFFTGPASRNPDNNFHARVQADWMPNESLVSFEDLYGGPYDYNDLSFSFTNVATEPPTPPVPEPGTLLLLGSGLAGIAFLRKRKKK